jgi:hypothetical protein
MRTKFVGLLVMVVLAGSGCPDTRREPGVDLGPMGRVDASPSADMDVPPPVDLGGGPTPDLGGGAMDGGGTRDIPAICSAVCDALGTCFGMPAGPECAMGCAPDLADCSPAQLDAIFACAMAGCAPEGEPPAPKVVTCLQAVSCIDMGGGTPPPVPPPPPAM